MKESRLNFDETDSVPVLTIHNQPDTVQMSIDMPHELVTFEFHGKEVKLCAKDGRLVCEYEGCTEENAVDVVFGACKTFTEAV